MQGLNKRRITIVGLCLVIAAAFVAHSARPGDVTFMPFEKEEAIEAFEALLGKARGLEVFPLAAQDPVMEMVQYRNEELEPVISYLIKPSDVQVLDPDSLILKKNQSEMISYSHQLNVWLQRGDWGCIFRQTIVLWSYTLSTYIRRQRKNLFSALLTCLCMIFRPPGMDNAGNLLHRIEYQFWNLSIQ